MNKNDDLNDDFGNGDDIDNDFGEFDNDTERRSIGDVISKNPAVKIGLVVGALVVIVGAITLFGGPKVKGPDSNVVSGNDLKEAPGTKELSPEMQQVIDEVNQKNAEIAIKQGTGFIPQPTETPKQQLQVPADEASAEDPLARWRDMQNERLKAQQDASAAPKTDPAAQQAAQALNSAMTAQMSEILSGKKINNLKAMKITSLEEILAAQQKNNQQQQQVQTAANVAAAQAAGIDPLTGQPITPAKILLPAGAIEYSQLLIEANSDIPGPVVALIVSGPFAGSRALGTFTRKEEYLVIQFTTLVNKKGVSIPIDAYALDPDTTLTGMATDVDRRYFERIILPAAANFIQGIGEAYAEKEGNTTIVTGDVVVQDDPPLDYKQQLAKGVEKAAERAGEVLEEEGDNTQPLVRVRAGTPMGILFMTPVTDQDFVVGTNNPASARVLQQQQQQNMLQQQLMLQQSQGSLQNPLSLLQSLQNGQNGNGQMAAPYGNYNNGNNGTSNGLYPIGSNTNGARSQTIFSTQDYLNGNR